MNWFVKHIELIIVLLGAISSFTFTLFKIFQWYVKKINTPIETIINNQTIMFSKVETIEKKLNDVCSIVGYQFNKNGGNSTTDKIDRIENTVNSIKDRQSIDFYLDNQPKFECDSNGYCIKVNYSWRELTGMSEEDALGNQWIKAVHPNDREKVSKEWELFVEKSLPFECKYRLLHPTTLDETLVEGKAIRKDNKNGLKIIVGTVEVLKSNKNEKNNRVYKTA